MLATHRDWFDLTEFGLISLGVLLTAWGVVVVIRGNRAARTRIHIGTAQGSRFQGEPRVKVPIEFQPFGQSWRIAEVDTRFWANHRELDWQITHESAMPEDPTTLNAFSGPRDLGLVAALPADCRAGKVRIRVRCMDGGHKRHTQRFTIPDE